MRFGEIEASGPGREYQLRKRTTVTQDDARRERAGRVEARARTIWRVVVMPHTMRQVLVMKGRGLPASLRLVLTHSRRYPRGRKSEREGENRSTGEQWPSVRDARVRVETATAASRRGIGRHVRSAPVVGEGRTAGSARGPREGVGGWWCTDRAGVTGKGARVMRVTTLVFTHTTSDDLMR